MVCLCSKGKYSVIQFLYSLIIQDIQGKYGRNEERKFEKWKMNSENGMGMCEYRCICEYGNILVLMYRYSGIDIGIVRKRYRYIDRKGLI